MEDTRKVFDTIPEKFEKWRPHYSKELFDFIVKTCDLNKNKSCLEIGPGTGQATDFALQSGCDYHAIELGEHFVSYMKQKYKSYKNFNIVNADFEKFQFEKEKYNLVYSAAAIQWIKEEYKEKFFNGVHEAIIKHGGEIKFNDTYVLYLYQK